MKPGPKNKKLNILITGRELEELQRHTHHMAEAFGLDRRIQNYKGKRPIGLHSWDFDCLLAVMESVLNDPREYPDKSDTGYNALNNLFEWLKKEEQKF
jgi:hypothetical protein